MNLRKVRIRMPKAQSGLEIKMRAGLGFNANQLSWPVMAGEFSEADLDVHKTLGPVERDEANLEAEVGETAVTNLNNDGIPEQYKIGGKRHYAGGTPLNLPDQSYIFSRDKSMKIKDPAILEQFGIKNFPRGGVTPAEIAKKYDLNKYKKILLDKDSDDMARDTAEMMISNYILKLGKLAIIQESMKEFPEGIPTIAMPYLESIGMDPMELLPDPQQVEQQVQAERENPNADVEAKYGRELRYYQVPPGQTGNQAGGNKYEYRIGKDGQEFVVITKPDGSQRISKDIQTAKAEEAKQNKSAAGSSGGGSRTKTSSAPSSYLGGLGAYVKPPLAGAMEKATATFDPRLTEEGNASYNNLTKALTENKDLMAEFNVEFEAMVKDAVANGSLSEEEARPLYMVAQDKTGEQAMNYFLKYQKQNYFAKELRAKILKQGGPDIFSHDFFWDKGAGKGVVGRQNQGNRMTTEFFKTAGFKDDELVTDLTSTSAVQAATRALLKLSNSDKYKQTFDDLGLNWETKGTYIDPGNVDDPYTGKKTISAVDKYYGNNTIDVTLGYNKKEPEPETTPKEKPKEEKLQDLKFQGFKEEQKRLPQKDAPWWIQDVILTTGAIGDFSRVKKYLPWQATPAVDFLEPTFYSPERELAANAEQLAIGAEGAAQFAGPQAYNARFSQMAGQAAKNSADILAKYNNQNVSVANEAQKFNVETFNQYAQQKAKSATDLYDKVTIANQYYDNAKNEAREKMRQSFVSGITNAAQAATLNSLYPNYAVDVTRGGIPEFIPGWGKPPIPEKEKTIADQWKEINELQGIDDETKRQLLLSIYKGKSTKDKDKSNDKKLIGWPGQKPFSADQPTGQ